MDESPCSRCTHLRVKQGFLPSEGGGRESEVYYCAVREVSSGDFILRYFGTRANGKSHFPACPSFQGSDDAS